MTLTGVGALFVSSRDARRGSKAIWLHCLFDPWVLAAHISALSPPRVKTGADSGARREPVLDSCQAQ